MDGSTLPEAPAASDACKAADHDAVLQTTRQAQPRVPLTLPAGCWRELQVAPDVKASEAAGALPGAYKEGHKGLAFRQAKRKRSCDRASARSRNIHGHVLQEKRSRQGRGLCIF